MLRFLLHFIDDIKVIILVSKRRDLLKLQEKLGVYVAAVHEAGAPLNKNQPRSLGNSPKTRPKHLKNLQKALIQEINHISQTESRNGENLGGEFLGDFGAAAGI
ncbi:MAG: hypothetical protein QW186_07370 [Candidatus Bathyarchaeia archaeon]